MNRHKKDIDLLIRKVFIFGLFLFVLFVFKSTNSSVAESSNKFNTFEKAFELKKTAILGQTISFKSSDNSKISCELFTFNNTNNKNYKLICSNNRINHLLLFSNQQFLDIKTHVINRYLHQVRASLSSEEIPLIS